MTSQHLKIAIYLGFLTMISICLFELLNSDDHYDQIQSIQLHGNYIYLDQMTTNRVIIIND